jgi:hypothetical protein
MPIPLYFPQRTHTMALPPPRTPTISDETLLYLSNFPGCPHALYATHRTIPLQALLPSSPATSTFLIPAFIESIQSLQAMGFSPATSVLILDKYDVTSVEFSGTDCTWGNLLSVAKGHIRSHPENAWPEQGVEEWRRVLDEMGVVWELREDIVDPANEELRKGTTAKEWVLEAVEWGWEFVNGVDGGIQERRREAEMGRGAARASADSPQRTSEASSAPDIKELQNIVQQQEKRFRRNRGRAWSTNSLRCW